MPLAQGMKDKLIRRDEIDLPNRKANEYNVRQYIKRRLKDIDEILWIFEQLPSSQLDKLFNAEDIKRIEQLEEKILEHIDIPPVERDKVVYRFNVKGDFVGDEIMKDVDAIIEVTLPAKEEEIELNTHIISHLDILSNSIKLASRKDKNVYSLKEFDSKVLRNIAKIAIKRGQAYQVAPVLEMATTWTEEREKRELEALGVPSDEEIIRAIKQDPSKNISRKPK